MSKIINRKGISVIEYSLLFVIAVAAFIAIQHYLTRAVCGRWKDSADTYGYGRQYDPKKSVEFDSNRYWDLNRNQHVERWEDLE